MIEKRYSLDQPSGEPTPESAKQGEQYQKLLLSALKQHLLFRINPAYNQAMSQRHSKEVEQEVLEGSDDDFRKIHQMVSGIRTIKDFKAFLELFNQKRLGLKKDYEPIGPEFLQEKTQEFETKTYPAYLEMSPKIAGMAKKGFLDRFWKRSGENN